MQISAVITGLLHETFHDDFNLPGEFPLLHSEVWTVSSWHQKIKYSLFCYNAFSVVWISSYMMGKYGNYVTKMLELVHVWFFFHSVFIFIFTK